MRLLLNLVALSATIVATAGGCLASRWMDGMGTHRHKTPATAEEPAVTRDQLIIHADFPLPPEHRMIAELVAEREQITEKLGLPPGTEPIHVYLFADEQSYRDHVSKAYPDFAERRAIFVETDVQLSVYAHWGDHVAEDLRHEVAHGYLHAAVPNMPLWLDEGIAEYCEVGRGRRGLNPPHVDLLQTQLAAGGWRPDLPRLETLASAANMTQIDYAESWLWVHYLLESSPDNAGFLKDTLTDLRGGKPAEPLSKRLARHAVDPNAALLEHLKSLP